MGTYHLFLKRVVPVAEENKSSLHAILTIRECGRLAAFAACMGIGKCGGPEAFHAIASPYHGLTCQGTVSEMLRDPRREILDVTHYFGSRKKIFNVHFRNIHGGFLNFQETFPDAGDVDMVVAPRAYKDVGYDGMLMPDHVPKIEGDDGGRQAFAFAFGYIRGLLQAVQA